MIGCALLQHRYHKKASKSDSDTGIKTKKQVMFHVTGFDRFHGVDNNPTKKLINKLPQYLMRYPLESGGTVVSCTVLETSGVGSLLQLAELQQKNKSMNWKEDEIIVVWLHLGVHSSQKNFRVEKFAFNEANFPCPDERQWEPKSQKISSIPSEYLKTSVPVDELVEALHKRSFPEAVVSDDPGRFVCNWLYFNSLHFSNLNSGDVSLFVHVPPFEEVDKNRQLLFVGALLDELTKIVSYL